MLAFMSISCAIQSLKDKTFGYGEAVAISFVLIVSAPFALCFDILFSPFEILGLVAYLLRRCKNNVKD